MTKRKVVKPQPTKLQAFWADVKAGKPKAVFFVAVAVIVLAWLVF